MPTLTIVERDAETILAAVLARYQTATNRTLGRADPIYLLINSFCLELAQQYSNIDFSGKQSLLAYVDSAWIEALAELWGQEPIAAAPSTCTVRFTFSITGAHEVAAGKRVTDGTFIWAATETTTGSAGTDYVDVEVECTTNGTATNGVTAGLINQIVDPIPLLVSVSNTTTTRDGRDVETTAAFRERLRDEPERRAVAGPRAAYEGLSLEASTSVHTAKALGPDDAASMASYDPPTEGEVHVIITMCTRDEDGEVTEVIPDPTDDLLNDVDEYLSAETRRPLGDSLLVKAPEWVDADVTFSYYIARSRSGEAAAIQTAVEEAVDAYAIWQQQIARDLNPSELIYRVMAAGAKRLIVTEPSFSTVALDGCVRLGYLNITYGGVEDD